MRRRVLYASSATIKSSFMKFEIKISSLLEEGERLDVGEMFLMMLASVIPGPDVF